MPRNLRCEEIIPTAAVTPNPAFKRTYHSLPLQAGHFILGLTQQSAAGRLTSTLGVMKHLPLLLAIATGTVFAQTPERPRIIEEQRGSVTNAHVEGSLAPTQDLACISLSESKQTYTPPDLHTAIAKCIAGAQFTKAAQLFMLSGIYLRFDAERIADKTVRGGGQVLILRTFLNFSKEQKEEFTKAFNQLAKNTSELQATCSELVRIGPPTYFPRYLILHGLNAFTSPNPLDNALIPNFDAESTWVHLQEAYAHCPK